MLNITGINHCFVTPVIPNVDITICFSLNNINYRDLGTTIIIFVL